MSFSGFFKSLLCLSDSVKQCEVNLSKHAEGYWIKFSKGENFYKLFLWDTKRSDPCLDLAKKFFMECSPADQDKIIIHQKTLLTKTFIKIAKLIAELQAHRTRTFCCLNSIPDVDKLRLQVKTYDTRLDSLDIIQPNAKHDIPEHKATLDLARKLIDQYQIKKDESEHAKPSNHPKPMRK